jgi:hypothetical protein
MGSRYLTTLAVVIAVIIGISLCGCKKEEPLKPFEERLYKQTKIAFVSDRDGDPEIYVINADGSGQKRLTNNPPKDGQLSHPSEIFQALYELSNTR